MPGTGSALGGWNASCWRGEESPRISLEAGPHGVALAARGHRSVEQTVDIPPGSSVTLECADLLPELIEPVPARPKPSKRHGSTMGYVLGGVGVGVGVAALATTCGTEAVTKTGRLPIRS